MQTYYHVTEKSNWESIQQHGLLPMQGERAMELNEIPAVFLFPSESDMDTALSQWLGEWFDEKEETIGQTIDLVSLIITIPDDFPIESSTVDYEKVSTVPIPPKYIQYHKPE